MAIRVWNAHWKIRQDTSALGGRFEVVFLLIIDRSLTQLEKIKQNFKKSSTQPEFPFSFPPIFASKSTWLACSSSWPHKYFTEYRLEPKWRMTNEKTLKSKFCSFTDQSYLVCIRGPANKALVHCALKIMYSRRIGPWMFYAHELFVNQGRSAHRRCCKQAFSSIRPSNATRKLEPLQCKLVHMAMG